MEGELTEYSEGSKAWGAALWTQTGTEDFGTRQCKLMAAAFIESFGWSFCFRTAFKCWLIRKMPPEKDFCRFFLFLARQKLFWRRRAEEGEHHYFLASIAPLILEKKKLSIHSFKLLHAALSPFVKVHTIYVMSLFLNIYVYTFFFLMLHNS